MLLTEKQVKDVKDFFEDDSYAEEKVGEQVVNNFFSDEVTSAEIGSGLYHVLSSLVSSVHDLRIVNETLIAVNGYSLNAIIKQVQEHDKSGAIWETLGFSVA